MPVRVSGRRLLKTAETRKLAHALIVDDHPLFCDALLMTLRSIPGVETVQTATCLEDAQAHVDTSPGLDVILLDLNLPDVAGLDGLIRLRAAAGDTPIVIVSSMTDNRIIGAALRAGATGFVPKHSQRDVFRQAFRNIEQGKTFLPEGFVQVSDDGAETRGRNDALDRLATLTNQQSRILQLICEGKLNKQIAFDLSIAETTVKAHVTAIMRKLGVQSRTQAVLIAGQARFSSLLPSDATSS